MRQVYPGAKCLFRREAVLMHRLPPKPVSKRSTDGSRPSNDVKFETRNPNPLTKDYYGIRGAGAEIQGAPVNQVKTEKFADRKILFSSFFCRHVSLSLLGGACTGKWNSSFRKGGADLLDIGHFIREIADVGFRVKNAECEAVEYILIRIN